MTDNAAAPAGLLTPASRALAGLVLAVAASLGQSVPVVGVQVFLLGGDGSGDPQSYFMVVGTATALLALAAGWLAWPPGRGRVAGWPGHLARAALIVVLVDLAGAALMILAGMFRAGF